MKPSDCFAAPKHGWLGRPAYLMGLEQFPFDVRLPLSCQFTLGARLPPILPRTPWFLHLTFLWNHILCSHCTIAMDTKIAKPVSVVTGLVMHVKAGLPTLKLWSITHDTPPSSSPAAIRLTGKHFVVKADVSLILGRSVADWMHQPWGYFQKWEHVYCFRGWEKLFKGKVHTVHLEENNVDKIITFNAHTFKWNTRGSTEPCKTTVCAWLRIRRFHLHANNVFNAEVVQRGQVGVLSLVILQDYLLEDPV